MTRAVATILAVPTSLARHRTTQDLRYGERPVLRPVDPDPVGPPIDPDWARLVVNFRKSL